MREKDRNIMLLAVSLILIISLFYFNIIKLPTASVLSVSRNVNIGTDGKVYTIVQLAVKNTDTASFSIEPANGFTLPNGTKLDKGQTVIVYLRPSVQKCVYPLTKQTYNLYGFVNLAEYYEINNKQRTQTIAVSTDKSGSDEVTVEGFSYNDVKTLYASDGKGIMTVETHGATQGEQDCPDGFIILNVNNNPIAVDKTDFFSKLDATKNCLYQLNPNYCFEAAVNTIYNSYNSYQTIPKVRDFADVIRFTDPASQTTKTKLEIIPKSTTYAAPILTLNADEDFFNFVRVAPEAPLVQPEIRDFTSQGIYEGETGTYRLKVYNPSDVAKRFSGNIDVNLGSISPKQFTVDVQPKSEGLVSFNYIAPSVTADQKVQFTGQVCDIYSGQSKCSPFSYSTTVYNKPESILPLPPDQNKARCGDGICSATEDSMNCPQDCGQTPPSQKVDCSQTPHSKLVNGACVCEEGYATKYDVNTGKMICEEPNNFGIIVMILAVIGVIGIIYTFGFGGRK